MYNFAPTKLPKRTTDAAVRCDSVRLHVWAYIKGVLDALLAGCTDYHSLRPDVWAINHPDHIRTYRQEERRDRADRKQLSRELRRIEKAAQAKANQ